MNPQEPKESQPEIVHNIPVVNPIDSTVASGPQPIKQPAVQVKKPLAQESVEKKAPLGSPPIMATIIACLVALVLIVAAVTMFKDN